MPAQEDLQKLWDKSVPVEQPDQVLQSAENLEMLWEQSKSKPFDQLPLSEQMSRVAPKTGESTVPRVRESVDKSGLPALESEVSGLMSGLPNMFVSAGMTAFDKLVQDAPEGWGEIYSQYKEEIDRLGEQAKAADPGAFAAGDIAGTVGGFAATGGASLGPNILARVAPTLAKRTLGKMVAGGLSNAPYGAVQGAIRSQGETAEDKSVDALAGGAIDFILGTLPPAAAATLRKIIPAAASKLAQLRWVEEKVGNTRLASWFSKDVPNPRLELAKRARNEAGTALERSQARLQSLEEAKLPEIEAPPQSFSLEDVRQDRLKELASAERTAGETIEKLTEAERKAAQRLRVGRGIGAGTLVGLTGLTAGPVAAGGLAAGMAGKATMKPGTNAILDAIDKGLTTVPVGVARIGEEIGVGLSKAALAAVKNFGPILANAQEKGGPSLVAATHAFLWEHYPEYREAHRETEKQQSQETNVR